MFSLHLLMDLLQCYVLCTVLYCPFLGIKKNWAVAESPTEVVFLTVIFIIMRHCVNIPSFIFVIVE